MLKFLSGFPVAALCFACAISSTSLAGKKTTFDLGREAAAEEVKAWDIDVRPDGQGLPEGQGKVSDGETIFAEQCAACHGEFGEGSGRWPVLAGGRDTLSDDDPVKKIGSYWPYASTIFDYVKRAMPFGNAQSLSNDDIYALTAYLLYLNEVVEDEEFVLSKSNFASIKMPNEKNFIKDTRMKTWIAKIKKPCMKNCKTKVEITSTAQKLDVTPKSDKDEKNFAKQVTVENDDECDMLDVFGWICCCKLARQYGLACKPIYQRPIPCFAAQLRQLRPQQQFEFYRHWRRCCRHNGGTCNALAKALHDEIKKVTDQPVKWVINENGQGHAMLGNDNWAGQGVQILAHVEAASDIDERGADALDRMKGYNKERAGDTRVQMPTKTFETTEVIELGDFRIEVKYLGEGHSPGDIAVWLPKQKLVISGDMAFHERLLPIFDGVDTKAWLESWTAFEALGATYVIPGHGHPTNVAQVRRYTKDYLVYLRKKIRDHIDNGGTLKDAFYVDQSPFAHLDTFDEVAKRNAGRVFEQMEFED